MSCSAGLSRLPSPGSFTTPGDHDRLTDANLQRIGTYTGFLNGPRYGGAGVPQIFRWMFNFDTTGTDTIGTAFIKGTFGFTAYDISLAGAMSSASTWVANRRR